MDEMLGNSFKPRGKATGDRIFKNLNNQRSGINRSLGTGKLYEQLTQKLLF